jgi:hypothetical protein
MCFLRVFEPVLTQMHEPNFEKLSFPFHPSFRWHWACATNNFLVYQHFQGYLLPSESPIPDLQVMLLVIGVESLPFIGWTKLLRSRGHAGARCNLPTPVSRINLIGGWGIGKYDWMNVRRDHPPVFPNGGIVSINADHCS